MKSFGLVIKEMHGSRLQVFMSLLVNYSCRVCALLRLQPSLGGGAGRLLVLSGKTSSPQHRPDRGSSPKVGTGTGDGGRWPGALWQGSAMLWANKAMVLSSLPQHSWPR